MQSAGGRADRISLPAGRIQRVCPVVLCCTASLSGTTVRGGRPDRTINQNADIWHCDTGRIVLMGFSAGGHLTAQYATSYDSSTIRTVIPNSKPVQATVLGYPVITADPKWTHQISMTALTGKAHCSPEDLYLFSCEKHVRADTPPTFLWHTAEDECVPVMNSLLYAQALAANHVPFELHVFPQGEHGLSTSDRQTIHNAGEVHQYDHIWLDCVKSWLNITLKR